MVNPDAALLKFRPKSLPPARQPRSERPKIHLQPRSDDLVTISRHRGEHDSLSHALPHALQFNFDVSDNETEESWRIDYKNVLGTPIRFDGARLGGNTPDILRREHRA